ncbi:hypothetical protein J6590_033028 [Homalodisca vitripennis]|nr:hypothetical protein J6590_033028 [Homalodisca vitripennis]
MAMLESENTKLRESGWEWNVTMTSGEYCNPATEVLGLTAEGREYCSIGLEISMLFPTNIAITQQSQEYCSIGLEINMLFPTNIAITQQSQSDWGVKKNTPDLIMFARRAFSHIGRVIYRFGIRISIVWNKYPVPHHSLHLSRVKFADRPFTAASFLSVPRSGSIKLRGMFNGCWNPQCDNIVSGEKDDTTVRIILRSQPIQHSNPTHYGHGTQTHRHQTHITQIPDTHTHRHTDRLMWQGISDLRRGVSFKCRTSHLPQSVRNEIIVSLCVLYVQQYPVHDIQHGTG